MILFFYGVTPSIARASNGQSEDATTIFVGIGVAWLVSAGLGWARPKLGLLITALMAIGVSFYLGQQHFESGASICDVGSSFSCSDVNKSEYSELFGVPLAYLGASYYGGMLMLAVFALRDPGISDILQEERCFSLVVCLRCCCRLGWPIFRPLELVSGACSVWLSMALMCSQPSPLGAGTSRLELP